MICNSAHDNKQAWRHNYNSAHDNKQAWRHNYMSGTHTAKFLVCHYLLTLMGGEEWVGGDIIT